MRVGFASMKLFGAVLLATSLPTTTASSQSSAFETRAGDSITAIRAFNGANRVGVSVRSPDREATDIVRGNVDPTTERAVGYVAIAAGVIAMTILLIGFYKLGKVLGH